ncbi:presenilins-associated rhomboid-like protein, mitochondrial isoform X1 [Megalops cyprinoides]|uniref:presenilins-associated rhomboid-like protein, mitochondrial isoform X1 n=1 Tax=Megalops cyprinoides TaxID=118141 RepID=UPI0018653E24|nr:presenilins-associated rhomboid-like protein, mitochondrial isoform X1 [Megalops cyprinoides]
MAWRGCFLRWTRGDICIATTRGNRFPLCTQQRCGFRKAPKKPEVKKAEVEEAALKQSELIEGVHQRKGVEPPTQPSPPRSFGRLFKPLVFTVGFSGCSFGAAAIWQYESLKLRVQTYMDEARAEWLEKLRPQKEGDLQKQTDDTAYWHRWWNQLSDFQKQTIVVLFQVNQWWDSLTQGQRTVSGIIVANALVLCCWRIPSLQRTMVKYFTSNPGSKTLCFPMVLSTFSHYSFLHMAANMYVLWSFSSSIVSLLGPEQFMAVYLSAGVISTFVSYMCKTATGRFGPSLGASGAIMTVLAAVCTKIPEAKLAIVFLPMFTFTAGSALKAIVAVDTVGLVLGWKFFDHAAHLGGTLFGIWYVAYGHELIWKNREPLVKMWHDLRTKGPGGGGAL